MSDGPIAHADAATASPADVMRQFESLGDTCEFGFVQRHFGIEPISLLRWAGAPLPGLVQALQARFAGLYRREDLMVIDGGSVLDMKYDLRFHAGPYAQDGGSGRRAARWDAEALAAHAREQRHIGFLLRTTLDTLAGRSKIFVYKTNAGVTAEEALQLKAALDLYGFQRLLCVMPPGSGEVAGQARLVAAGVKLAGISRFAPYTCQDDVDAECWLSVCRSALGEGWGDEAAVAPGPDASPAPPAATPPAFELTPNGVMLLNPALAAGAMTALYHTLLLRGADGEGLRALSGMLSRGESALEDTIAAMLESEEFASLVPRFLERYQRRMRDRAPVTPPPATPPPLTW